MKALLRKLQSEHSGLIFSEGDHFFWSPKTNTVTYSFAKEHDKQEITLLHELSHALLDHSSFETDFELLLLEVAAWDKAQELGRHYEVDIPESHIESCLDTYRDWLHLRSTCPTCTCNAIQSKTTRAYNCSNCNTNWTVSESRLCRSYRKVSKQKAL